jgi:hypothetical protein
MFLISSDPVVMFPLLVVNIIYKCHLSFFLIILDLSILLVFSESHYVALLMVSVMCLVFISHIFVFCKYHLHSALVLLSFWFCFFFLHILKVLVKQMIILLPFPMWVLKNINFPCVSVYLHCIPQILTCIISYLVLRIFKLFLFLTCEIVREVTVCHLDMLPIS